MGAVVVSRWRPKTFSRNGRPRRGVVSICLAIVTTLPACSGKTSDPGTPPQACAVLAASRCGKLQSCNPNGLLTAYGDAGVCETREQMACAAQVAADGSGAAVDGLTACAHAYDSLSCDEVLQGAVPSACDIHGSLTQGSVCVSDMQCAGANGYCRVQSGVCGTCATRGAAGAQCVADADCEHGLVCGKGPSPALGSPALEGGTCVAPGGVGESCPMTNTCLAALACVDFVCAERAPAGARCQPLAHNCDEAQGFVCDSNTVCEKIRTATAGAACGYSTADGSLTECTGGGWCNTNGTGVAGTCESALADGAPCDATSGPFCLAPAACTNGVCLLPDPAACR